MAKTGEEPRGAAQEPRGACPRARPRGAGLIRDKNLGFKPRFSQLCTLFSQLLFNRKQHNLNRILHSLNHKNNAQYAYKQFPSSPNKLPSKLYESLSQNSFIQTFEKPSSIHNHNHQTSNEQV